MAIEPSVGPGGLPMEVIERLAQEAQMSEEATPVDLVDLPENPNIMEMEDGSALVGEFLEDEEPMIDVPFDGNLADVIDEFDLGRISSDLIGSIEDDLSSREEWEEMYRSGIEYLGMKSEDRTQPFEGASGVVHPVLAESVTQFQAQAYRELLPAGGPVRTQVVGAQTEQLVKQAERVKDFMNYKITYEMEEYDPEMDQMLFYLPIVGSTFKKVYFDPLKNRAVSKFVHAEDLVVPYGATDLITAPRITHIIKMDSNEVRKLQLGGFYSDIDLPDGGYGDDENDEVTEAINDTQGVHPSSSSEELTIYEVHAELDIPGFEDVDEMGEPTGLKLPYIVTILKDTNKVLAIRRNYSADDPLRRANQYFVHYKFLPGLGFYGLGLTHMIGGIAKASTSLLRQLIDAGTLSNLPAGFKAKGARITNDDTPLQPGEFRDIDVVSGDLRGTLMPLPFKEPSATLYNLLGTLVDAGRRFAAMADMKIGEMGGETPVGTTMAIMERGTKVMSAIHKRLHYSQKIEFKLLAKIFAKTIEPYPYMPSLEVGPEAKAQDFDDRIDVLPVSDPNIFSMAQRIALAQTQLQLVQSNPQIHGGPQGLYQAYRKMYEALGVSNIDAILPPPPQPMPMNPAKENQGALMGAPLQAFPQQDHQSHMAAHLAMMSTPAVQANPMAIASLQGHIQEHIGMLAEKKAQEEVLSQVPPEMAQNPQIMPMLQEAMQARAAELIAELTEQFTQAVTPAEQQDPLVTLRQQEIALKAQENQRKAKEAEADMAMNQEKERNKILVAQQRIDQQDESIAERSRIAEERIQAQKEIALLNASLKGTG